MSKPFEHMKGQLAQNIKSWAEDHKMTQAEVAVFLETTQPRVSLILNKKLDNIAIDALFRYNEMLGFKYSLIIE